jgi:hypothetical protein
MFVFVEVLVGFIILYLKFLNRRHASMRSAVGKSAEVQDESMMRKVDLQALGKGVGEAARAGMGEETGRGGREEDNAFRDMTDLKNEDFIYVY